MNPIKPEPPWSPEAHLEHVYRRGRQLRRRRQFGATSAAIVAVVGLAVMIGGTTSTVLHPLRTLAGVGGGDSADNSAGATTTTEAKSAGKSHRTTTTARRGATSTTSSAAKTTPTVSAASSTSLPSGSPTPPPTSPLGACKATALVYSTVTNKPAYRVNEQVGIELVVENTSDRPCYVPGPCGAGPWVSIEDTAGAVIWKNSPHPLACSNPPPQEPLLNPNDTHNYGTVGSWNQIVCPNGDGCTGSHAVPGTYRAIAHRGSITAAGATFALRG